MTIGRDNRLMFAANGERIRQYPTHDLRQMTNGYDDCLSVFDK